MKDRFGEREIQEEMPQSLRVLIAERTERVEREVSALQAIRRPTPISSREPHPDPTFKRSPTPPNLGPSGGSRATNEEVEISGLRRVGTRARPVPAKSILLVRDERPTFHVAAKQAPLSEAHRVWSRSAVGLAWCPVSCRLGWHHQEGTCKRGSNVSVPSSLPD